MLAEIRDKMVHSLAIKVPLDDLSDDLISELQDLMGSYKGNKDLKFLIYDPKTNVHIQMFSRSHKINITEELLAVLDKKSPNIMYQIS